jgi:DNA-directed RNA polymerase specialized sigma24 family protein
VRTTRRIVHVWTASLHSSRPDRTRRPRSAPEVTPTPSTNALSELKETDLLRAAFRDVHGDRLHGFTVLLSLGDRSRAAAIAGEVLTAGAARAARLRHPERAAAWLRARAVAAIRRSPDSRRHSPAERRAVLTELGVADATAAALRALPIEQRAALIAGSVERFSITDVATILGRDPIAARQVLQSARRRFVDLASGEMRDVPPDALPGGEVAERVREAAARAIGSPAVDPRA